MSFSRSLLLLILAVVLGAAGFLALGFVTGGGEYRGGYAVISSDASIEDRTLKALLLSPEDEKKKSNFAGAPVGESSQWALLDQFDSLEAIPLEKYDAKVSAFDPRNDGYAAKLKNVFVRDGRRYVYIPLKAGNWTPASMDRQFKNLLGDIPFSVEYYGIGKPGGFFFLVFAAASLLFLIVCFVKKNSRPCALSMVVVLPLLSSLAFSGVAGLALCALFLGFFAMLYEPVNELNTLFASKTKGQRLKYFYKDIIEPYKPYWYFAVVFAAAIAVVAAVSRIKFFFILPVSLALCAVYFLSIKTLSLFSGSRRRFTPVLILRRRSVDFSFSAYMLPFAAAALLAMIISPRLSGASVSDAKFDHIISEQDYYDHLNFQYSFSMRQLGGAGDASYHSYFIDESGLPSVDTRRSGEILLDVDKFPAFPLKHLMDFLSSVNSGTKTSTGAAGGSAAVDIFSCLILLLFILPGLFFKGKFSFPSEINLAGLKRFSAKTRRAGSFRKNTLSKSKTFNIRKDA